MSVPNTKCRKKLRIGKNGYSNADRFVRVWQPLCGGGAPVFAVNQNGISVPSVVNCHLCLMVLSEIMCSDDRFEVCLLISSEVQIDET